MFFLGGDYIVYVWLIVALLFLFAELFTPGLFFFVAFAIGCVAAALFSFLDYSFTAQCLVALGVSIISFFFLRHFCAVKFKGGRELTNVDALHGCSGIVVNEIRSEESGRVKVKGEIWPAKTKGDQILEKGAKVKVMRIEGNHLIVE